MSEFCDSTRAELAVVRRSKRHRNCKSFADFVQL